MLELGESFIQFEPDKNLEDGNSIRNFFDVSSQKICTMKNNGSLGMTAKNLENDEVINIKIRDRGEPSTVKFSSDGRLCAMQRVALAVDIIFLEKKENSICAEITLTAKSKEPLLAVEWATNNQILLVTNHSVELYFINENKKVAKILKSTNINAAWAIYYAPSKLLLIANGASCSNLQPIVVAHSQFTRMKNFEIDFSGGLTKENFLEKDCSVATLYGKIFVMVLRYSIRNASMLDLYQLPMNATSVAGFQFSLNLGFTGGCGIHVIDNLVVVHHQQTSSSLIFDIKSADRKNYSSLVTTKIESHSQHQPPPEFYTQYWFTFLPNIIIDSSNGFMYSIKLKNEKSMLEISDKNVMLGYLLRRSNEKKLFITSLLNCLRAKVLSLRQSRKLFANLAENIRNVEMNQESSKNVLFCDKYETLKISQQEMQSAVLIPLKEDLSSNKSYVANIMLQYLRSLYDNNINPEAYLIEMIVETLGEAGEMLKLQQIVTYRVINDSKPLAFLLISYEARCSTLFQSGVDILARNKANDEIVEIMLDKNQIVDAFRFIDVRNLNDSLIPKVIEAANKKCSRQTRHAIKEHLNEKKAKAGFDKSIDDLYNEEEVKITNDELATNVLFEF